MFGDQTLLVTNNHMIMIFMHWLFPTCLHTLNIYYWWWTGEFTCEGESTRTAAGNKYFLLIRWTEVDWQHAEWSKAHEAVRSEVSHLLPLTWVIKTHLSRWDATSHIKNTCRILPNQQAAHLDRTIKHSQVTGHSPVRWFTCQEVRAGGGKMRVSFWPVSSSERAPPTSYNESYTPPEKDITTLSQH